MLDRDFVLTLESEATQSSCAITPDREGQVALASLRIPPLAANEEKPLGAQGGDRLLRFDGRHQHRSRRARRRSRLLNLLRPEDAFNVTLFGSQYTCICSARWCRPAPAM
jgi:hypothetical protein